MYRKFLCFKAASSTVREDLHNVYCCWRYKSAKRALLCNNQYFCVVDSGMYLDNTHRMHYVLFSLQQWLDERVAAFCYTTLPVLFHPKYPIFSHFHPFHSAALICRITSPLLPPATPLGEVSVAVNLVQCICVILTQSYALRTVVKDVDLIVCTAFNTRTRLRLT